MKILRRLSEYYDWYDSFHGVKSRKSGKKIIVDITLGFTTDKTAGEIFDLSGRIKPKSGGSGECIMKSNIATSPTHHSGLRFQILEGSKGVVGEILKS